MNIGQVILTEGAYNDTAVARLYGFDYDFIETSKALTDELDELLTNSSINAKRSKHWTTDAGYENVFPELGIDTSVNMPSLEKLHNISSNIMKMKHKEII